MDIGHLFPGGATASINWRWHRTSTLISIPWVIRCRLIEQIRVIQRQKIALEEGMTKKIGKAKAYETGRMSRAHDTFLGASVVKERAGYRERKKKRRRCRHEYAGNDVGYLVLGDAIERHVSRSRKAV